MKFCKHSVSDPLLSAHSGRIRESTKQILQQLHNHIPFLHTWGQLNSDIWMNLRKNTKRPLKFMIKYNQSSLYCLIVICYSMGSPLFVIIYLYCLFVICYLVTFFANLYLYCLFVICYSMVSPLFVIPGRRSGLAVAGSISGH